MSVVAIRRNKYMQQRRGHRAMLSIPVLITGTHEDGNRFSEESRTLVVNSHGALILLAETVKPGQHLKIRHIKSGEARECVVVDIGAKHENKNEVGIELVDPSKRFWHVSFPPDDWSPHSPEAKHFHAKRSPR